MLFFIFWYNLFDKLICGNCFIVVLMGNRYWLIVLVVICLVIFFNVKYCVVCKLLFVVFVKFDIWVG